MQMTNKRTEGKIPTHYGMKDYFKYYKEHDGVVQDRLLFHKIVSELNQGIVDLIIHEGIDFTPATLQFTFCIRKSKKVPRIKDGKFINPSPIDWKTTNQLWLDDEEAREKKIIIKFLNNHTSKYVFRIKALKTGNTYINKKLYRFKAVRDFSRTLGQRILDPNQENFNAFKLF
jgi:hypothetical protein